MSTVTGISRQCAKMIISILIMTRLKDKQQLIETSRLMRDVADNSVEYSPMARQIYRTVHNFFKVVWMEDLNRILDVVFEGKKI